METRRRAVEFRYDQSREAIPTEFRKAIEDFSSGLVVGGLYQIMSTVAMYEDPDPALYHSNLPTPAGEVVYSWTYANYLLGMVDPNLHHDLVVVLNKKPQIFWDDDYGRRKVSWLACFEVLHPEYGVLLLETHTQRIPSMQEFTLLPVS